MKTKIEITNGKFTFGRERLNEILLCEDGKYMVEKSKWKHSRSLRQNALLWKWNTVIGEHFGYHPDEMHEVFIEMFAPRMTIKKLDGTPKRVPVRSSKMNVEQMSRYMERIDQFAAENGIKIPHPEPDLI